MTRLKRETFKTKNKHGEKGAALLYIGPVFCHGVVQEKYTKTKRIMINKSHFTSDYTLYNLLCDE